MKYQIKHKHNYAYVPVNFDSRMDAEMYLIKQGYSVETAYLAMQQGDIWIEETPEYKTLVVRESVFKTYRNVPVNLKEEDWEEWVCQQDQADDECVDDRSIQEYEQE